MPKAVSLVGIAQRKVAELEAGVRRAGIKSQLLQCAGSCRAAAVAGCLGRQDRRGFRASRGCREFRDLRVSQASLECMATRGRKVRGWKVLLSCSKLVLP